MHPQGQACAHPGQAALSRRGTSTTSTTPGRQASKASAAAPWHASAVAAPTASGAGAKRAVAQVRAALRAAARDAARAATAAPGGRPGRGGAPALLRSCLAAHGGALLRLARGAATNAELGAQLEQARRRRARKPARQQAPGAMMRCSAGAQSCWRTPVFAACWPATGACGAPLAPACEPCQGLLLAERRGGAQARARALELAAAAARAQAAARETRAHARRQAAAFEAHRAQLAAEAASLAQRCGPQESTPGQRGSIPCTQGRNMLHQLRGSMSFNSPSALVGSIYVTQCWRLEPQARR